MENNIETNPTVVIGKIAFEFPICTSRSSWAATFSG